MKFRRTSLFSLVLSLVATLLWRVAPIVHAQQGNTAVLKRPERVIDEKARAAVPGDSASVRGVADAVFDYPHVLGRMPVDMENTVKERLVLAEAEFLQGKRPGVREEDVVLFVNQVSNKLKLTDFAKSSKKQVRALRMKTALASPVFMGRGMADGDMKIGDSISDELSPLQAVHLIGVLLDQKFLDPNFQLSPEDWDRDSHHKEIERIREQQAILKSQPRVEHRIATRENPKRQDLQNALTQSTSSMSLADAQGLIEAAFKTLKIER
jgi:hypothetical protein